MTRPGNLVFYGMLIALGMDRLFHPSAWLVVVAAFAIGWFINEGARRRDA